MLKLPNVKRMFLERKVDRIRQCWPEVFNVNVELILTICNQSHFIIPFVHYSSIFKLTGPRFMRNFMPIWTLALHRFA